MLLQFRIGALALAFVAGADFCVGLYCLVLDEIVKDRRLVRTKPYQMDLDDALALTDDDAMARDMFARSSQKDGRSFYMEASQPHAPLVGSSRPPKNGVFCFLAVFFLINELITGGPCMSNEDQQS
jgi:hypothetical protein